MGASLEEGWLGLVNQRRLGGGPAKFGGTAEEGAEQIALGDSRTTGGVPLSGLAAPRTLGLNILSLLLHP